MFVWSVFHQQEWDLGTCQLDHFLQQNAEKSETHAIYILLYNTLIISLSVHT